MKVVLRSDLEGLGKRGDVVEVADGYARNYLLGKGLALRFTPGVVTQAELMRKARDRRELKARQAAEAVARRLVGTVIQIPARAGASGRLFGSVTAADIAEAIQAQTGLEVDRRRLRLDEPIKALGTHEVPVRLHPEVEFQVTVEVTPAS